MILGRTDLRKGVSGAKFDAESDFEVHLAVAPQKPSQNSEKLIFRSENFADFFSVFRDFRLILEDQGFFGRQNQLAHQILLQIHLS